AADFERHLVSCAECVHALEAQENLRNTLQRAALYERAPAELRAKLDADFGAPVQVPRPSISWSNPWRWFAGATALLLVPFVGWRLVPGLRVNSGETALVSAIVDAHLRSLQPGHLEDVVSSDQHTVKPWFDGKLDFAPPVRNFADREFPLQGGRLDVVRGRSVAVLVYARRKHLINFFVCPIPQTNSPPFSGSRLVYNWVNWRKDGMKMCAVSDFNPADLSELQRLLTE